MGLSIPGMLSKAFCGCMQSPSSSAWYLQVRYDPQETDYKQLLKVFLASHDPTSLNKQGGDTGSQYRSGLYFHTPEQQQIAEEVMAEAAASYEVSS